MDRLVFRPLRGRGSGGITMAIASLGIGIALRAVTQTICGPSNERYTTSINKAVTIFWDLQVKPDQFMIVALTLVPAVAVYFLLYRERLGKAMRAMELRTAVMLALLNPRPDAPTSIGMPRTA